MAKLFYVKNGVTLVDDEDYDNLHTFQCYYNESTGYVMCYKSKRNAVVPLHRIVTKAPKGRDIDHINGNKLDNMKENLRVVTRSQNMMNNPRHQDNITGYKGVDFVKSENRFRARITKDGKTKHLGYFKTAEEASKAYEKASKELFGVYAYVITPHYKEV